MKIIKLWRGLRGSARRSREVPSPHGAEGAAGAAPNHVAIIMDGNGRWAKERGLPRLEGHRAGARAIRDTITSCVDLGVKYLTIYTFSQENWRRPEAEVEGLMALFEATLKREVPELHSEGVRIRVIGRIRDLPASTQRAFRAAEDKTKDNDRLVLGVALNYGGRGEIVDAARDLAERVARGELQPKEIDDDMFSASLYTHGIPDPELVIRTGGDLRVSNFLLWQIAYAELWVTPALWPDFVRGHLVEAIEDFRRRERRFGGLGA